MIFMVMRQYKEKKVYVDIPFSLIDSFIDNYRTIKVRMNFNHENDMLTLKDITTIFQEKEYKGSFIGKANKTIKFKISIEDDIFKLIKIGDKK